MKEASFVAKNESEWKALEAFNNRLQKSGIKKAGTGEVREFARLFRLAGFHLAYAKTHYPGGTTVTFLNRLVGVSHNFFYVRERGSFFEIFEYFFYTVPRAVRGAYKYWVCAAAVFMFGVMFAGFYVAGDTTRIAEIMPAGMASGFTPGETPQDLGEGAASWDGSLMSALFITNNTAVAFNAFALGIFGGVVTLFILFYNGIIVGGLAGFLYAESADMLVFYSLILPHGVLELFAIFLAGGCGLMLGKGLLIPGEFTRRDSLVFHARKAAKLIPPIVIMLVLAAFIEGFFTPLEIPPWHKIAFAGLTAIGIAAYFSKGVWNENRTE